MFPLCSSVVLHPERENPMTDASSAEPARDANGRFGPGNPGRPPGSCNRLSRRKARALLALFDGRTEALLDYLVAEPMLYLEVVGCLLPRFTIKNGD
jgi:hypothetical protein